MPTPSINLEKLPAYLKAQRWFAGKAAPIKQVTIVDSFDLSEQVGAGVTLAVVQVTYELGHPDRYLLPLRVREDGDVEDALETPELPKYLLRLVREGGRLPSGSGALKGEPIGKAGSVFEKLGENPRFRKLNVEQSNTSLVFSDEVIFKIIRKLELGQNPEREMGRFLATRTDFRATPTLLGALELEGAVSATVGLAHDFIEVQADGWQWMLEAFKKGAPATDAVLTDVEAMGDCVGRLHLALAADKEDPAFAPEPILTEDLHRWSSSIVGELGVTLARAGQQFPDVLERRDALVERGQALARAVPSGQKIRQHGDLHLGQVLRTKQGWLLIDFEGEPARAVEQRREKHSPLRDVAGMLRSFAYAAASAADLPREARVQLALATRERFFRGWKKRLQGSGLLPEEEALRALLDALELEKTLYEVRYELQSRPDWAHIPIASLMHAEVLP